MNRTARHLLPIVILGATMALAIAACGRAEDAESEFAVTTCSSSDGMDQTSNTEFPEAGAIINSLAYDAWVQAECAKPENTAACTPSFQKPVVEEPWQRDPAAPTDAEWTTLAVDCATVKPVFVTGIQGGDGLGVFTVEKGPADAQTAGFYITWANAGGGANGWEVYFPFNNPAAVPANYTGMIDAFRMKYVRSGHSTTYQGDRQDVRAAGNWAMNPGANMGFLDDNRTTFLNNLSTSVVNAANCGKKIYVHSGGGGYIAAALRHILDTGKVWDIEAGKKIDIVGLEMAFTEEGLAMFAEIYANPCIDKGLEIRNISAMSSSIFQSIIPEVEAIMHDLLWTETSTVGNAVNNFSITLQTAVGPYTAVTPHAGIAAHVLGNPGGAPGTTDGMAWDSPKSGCHRNNGTWNAIAEGTMCHPVSGRIQGNGRTGTCANFTRATITMPICNPPALLSTTER